MKQILILCLLLSSGAFAQKKQNVYFLDKNDVIVDSKEKAAYIRVIQEPDSGAVNYNLLEFYLDAKRKRIGTVSKFQPKIILEGPAVSYFKNGNRESLVHYNKGRKKGLANYYYENGQLMEESEYIESNNSPEMSRMPFSNEKKILSYFDSLGNQQVTDGNGYIKVYNDSTKITEGGKVRDGLKDSLWLGHFRNYTYEETYEKGKLVGGISTGPDGQKYQYSRLEELPGFKGGMSEFYRYFGKTYAYPPVARNNGIAGTLIIGFVVENDGSLSNFKVVKDLGMGTGEEAVAVLKKSADWQPGKQRGIPVRVSYTLPVKLSLGFLRTETRKQHF